jgi:hypothetical protein
MIVDLATRSELLTRLYKLQGELFGLKAVCQEHGALTVGLTADTCLSAVNEQINEFTGKDEPGAGADFLRHKKT